MTTRTIERQRTKCGQYWPDDVNGEPLDIAFSPFVVNLLSEEKVGREDGMEANLDTQRLAWATTSSFFFIHFSIYTTCDCSQRRGTRRRRGR